MKKLLFIFTLICAFSINANAQEQKMKAVDHAKKDASELADLVGLTPTQTEDMARLFEMKYQTLEIPNLSEERKSEMARIVEMKIMASLQPKQIELLEANKELLKKLKY